METNILIMKIISPYSILLLNLGTMAVLPFLLVIPIGHFRKKQKENFNIKAPRTIPLPSLPTRINWSHQNTLEALPIFTVACLLALITQISPNLANVLSTFFLVTRILYCLAYAMNFGWLRFSLWFVGMLSCYGLLGLSIFKILEI